MSQKIPLPRRLAGKTSLSSLLFPFTRIKIFLSISTGAEKIDRWSGEASGRRGVTVAGGRVGKIRVARSEGSRPEGKNCDATERRKRRVARHDGGSGKKVNCKCNLSPEPLSVFFL